jgi:hypothetical protein
MSASVVRQLQTETRIARAPRQVVPPNHLAALLDAGDHGVGAAVVLAVRGEKADEPLVHDRSGNHLGAGDRPELPYEPRRVGTRGLDDARYALRPERAQCRVHREPARAARPFGVPVQLVTPGRVVREVARAGGHRGSVRLAVPDEGQAAVEGSVQPLVRVGGPRVGPIDAGKEVPKSRTRGGP